MNQQYTTAERIELIQNEIAIWEHRDPAYTEELYEELKALVDEANADHEIWCEHAVEGIDYVVNNKDIVEETKEEDDEPIKRADGGFLSDESERMMKEMHQAIFFNPKKTKEQKARESLS